MIKKPRLNLVNRGGGIRSNKPVAAVTRRPDPPPPPPPAPFLPPEIPPAPVAPIKVTTESTPPPPKSTAEKVGGLLAEARKAQGRTIAELAEATHIRDIHLQALEAGAIERLPGITFVAGFMRLYARHLNIADTDPIESFLETLDQKRQGLQMERFPAPTKANHRPGLGLIILGIGALVGCFMAYDRYYAPTRNIPAIPSAPPLRVTSTATEGEDFSETATTLETAPETPAPASSSPPTASETSTPAPVSKPAATTVAEPTQPQQGDSGSIFSFWGRTSNRISTTPEPAPEPEATASNDTNSTGTAEEEDTPGDFDNAALQATHTPENTTDLPAVVPATPSPILAADPNSPASASLDPATVSGTSETFMPPPELPQVSPRIRAGSVPSQPATTEVSDAVSPPTQQPTAPVASGNAKTKAREQIIDAQPVPVYSENNLTPNARSIALVAKELVWIQIQDKDGIVLKDMVMQPEHVFHIPDGETFYAILGNASGVQLRVGDKTLPFFGESGEVIQDLELSPEPLLNRARGL